VQRYRLTPDFERMTDVTTLKIWARKSTFSYTGSVEQ
jgi:hypothetical protein